jgi:cellulose synthase (UDP-forming)
LPSASARAKQRRAAEAARIAARAAEEEAKAKAAETKKEKKRKKREALAAAAALLVTLPMVGAMFAPGRAQAAPLATTLAPPAAANAATSGGGVVRERLTFKDLRIRNAVRLQGTHGEISIPFGVRKNQVVTQATITLQLAWSPALLGDLSQLVVLVNGETVQTVALRPQDSGGQLLTLQVNPALFLPGDNQLNLRLIGHYARDCEDPFNSVLWANISNTRSWLDLTLQDLPGAPDLSHLPGPFFDRADNTALKIPFVFAGQPHHGELEAAASVASWLGSMASYRGFSFQPLYGQLPAGNAIVFLKGAEPCRRRHSGHRRFGGGDPQSARSVQHAAGDHGPR